MIRLESIVKLDCVLYDKLSHKPSAENINKFLWSFLEQIKSPLDNLFSEISLQALLEGCMRASKPSTLDIATEFEYSNKTRSDLIF